MRSHGRHGSTAAWPATVDSGGPRSVLLPAHHQRQHHDADYEPWAGAKTRGELAPFSRVLSEVSCTA
jgi:hypothetical protein